MSIIVYCYVMLETLWCNSEVQQLFYQENSIIARQEDVLKFGIRGLLEAKGIVIRKTVKKGVFHDFQLC